MHPEDIERHLATAFDARRKFRNECRFQRADGEYRWILVSGVPLYREGQFAGYIGSCVDITEQRLTMDRLKISESQLKYAQHLAKVGSSERHIETGAIHWSDEKLRIMGLSAVPPNRAALLNHIYPADRQKFEEIENRIRSGDTPLEVEYHLIRPDGELRLLRAMVDGIRSEKGELVTVVGASQDVTEMKRAHSKVSPGKSWRLWEPSPTGLRTTSTTSSAVCSPRRNLLWPNVPRDRARKKS